MNGFFITFEGGEGSGKTTQIARLAERLRAEGHAVVTTREPGGTPGADAVRHVVLSGAAEALGAEVETILFAAARADHVEVLIRPALEAGQVVLCDRFHDSTRVYQGLRDGEDEMIDILEAATLQGRYPDLTLVLDIDAAEGLQRASRRRQGEAADRFERESLVLHADRRRAFLAIAADEPERCVVIDAARPVDEIAKEIAFIVGERLECRRLETAGRSGSRATPTGPGLG